MSKFFPGWKMTTGQHAMYFRLLGQCFAAAGLVSAADKEAFRRTIHLRAFGGPKSAKEIDHMRGFDDFKAACLALLQPDNVGAQMRQAEMPHTRLVFACRQKADEAYIAALCKDRFGTADWTDLSVEELTQLRNTLEARMAAKKPAGPALVGAPF